MTRTARAPRSPLDRGQPRREVALLRFAAEQVTDDGGATADRLNGFSGRAFGAGPIITYLTKMGKSHLDFRARYIHEFEKKRRVEGDLFLFSASFKF